MIFKWRDAIEDRDVVVAHVGGAVGAGFEIRRGGQESQIEAMSFAQPAVGRIHRFQPLLWPTAMRRSTFQSKNGQKVLTHVL